MNSSNPESSRYLNCERDGHIATIWLQNPPTHTINAAGSNDLCDTLEALAEDSEIRVVVLTGASENVFVRHYEVGELASSSERLSKTSPTPRPTESRESGSGESQPRRERGLRGAMNVLESMDQISVAAINGLAMGGGLELALACDFRLARSGAFRLGLPETGVGILPGGGGTQRLTRLVGIGKALDLILHGTLYTPDEALRLGVVHRVLPEPLGEYRAQVGSFVANLAERAPRALANSKRAIREGAQLPLAEGLRREAELFAELMATEDAALALRAAFDGRERPVFRGR